LALRQVGGMETLNIRLFGAMDIRSGERAVPALPTLKSRALLGFLLLHRNRRYGRETLSDMLWPALELREARRCLRTELWRVHSALEDSRNLPKGSLLSADRSQVGFAVGEDCWLDVAEFESTLDRVPRRDGDSLTSDARRCLRRAVALYRGDLLEDLDYPWCLLERERLKARARSALELLLHHHRTHGHWEQVTKRCYQLLDLDRLNEFAHRELMRSFYMLGNRSSALRQFQTCTELLDRELDVEPMVETIALWREIKRGREDDVRDSSKAEPLPSARGADADGRAPAEDIRRAVAELDAAADSLERARARLEAAARSVMPSADRLTRGD
jgi:DNA-binding SARP family transcriptional activator